AISAAEPSYKADRELRRRLFGTHPYARSATGEAADVDALTAADLSSWWKTFARPDQATLICAGDLDADRAVALAKRAFGDWQAPPERPNVVLPPLPPAGPRHIYLVDHPGVQSQIRVVQLSIKRDHA